MVVNYREGSRVMAYMPQEAGSKMRKLTLPYHGLFRLVEVRLNCLLVRSVVLPRNKPI